MKIPEVAKRMREIAELIQGVYPGESGELFELADELKRRFSGPHAPASSTKMTPELTVIRKSVSDAEMKIKSTTAPTPGWSVTSFRVGAGRDPRIRAIAARRGHADAVVQQVVDQVASARPRGHAR